MRNILRLKDNLTETNINSRLWNAWRRSSVICLSVILMDSTFKWLKNYYSENF